MLRTLGVIAGARVASTACQAVTLLVLARTLGPTEFGRFAAVLGVLTALSFLADGGATYAVGRWHMSPSTIVGILRAGRLLSTATLLVSLPVLVVMTHGSDPVTVAAFLLLSVWVPLERQAEITGAYLLARGHEGVVGATYLLRRAPTLVALLLMPVAASPEAVFAVTTTVTAGVAVALLDRRVGAEIPGISTGRFPDDVVPQRAVWTLLRPFWLAVAGQGVRQVDVAVLGLSAGPTAAGMFAPASRLVPALLLVPGTYTQLLLARLSAGRGRLTARPVVAIVAVSTVVFVPLAVLADRWVPFALGDAYTASVDVVRVVVVSLVLAALSSVFGSALHAADRSARVAVAVWTGATSTIGLLALWGADHGAIGAAWAVAAGYLMQFVLMVAFHLSIPRVAALPTQ